MSSQGFLQLEVIPSYPMSLVKIPCILVAAVGLHVGATPPTPRPDRDDQRMRNRLEDGVMKHRSLPFSIKTIAWGAALAESAVIVASYWKGNTMARGILSKLVWRGDVGGIRLSPAFLCGAFLAGLGGWIRWKCYRTLGRFFTFEMVIRKDHTLITSGPYSIVRHPGYTGAILAILGTVLVHGSPGSWVRECGILDTPFGQVATGVFLVLSASTGSGLMIRMPKEDQALKERFGKEWEAWAAHVPYRLVPGVF